MKTAIRYVMGRGGGGGAGNVVVFNLTSSQFKNLIFLSFLTFSIVELEPDFLPEPVIMNRLRAAGRGT